MANTHIYPVAIFHQPGRNGGEGKIKVEKPKGKRQVTRWEAAAK
jgi:hypothetical protein